MDILAIIIIIIVRFTRIDNHQDRINSKVNSLGGHLISYEKRDFFTSIGPFIFIGKNQMIYRIEYEVDGIKKEGWVRFGRILAPDWRM